MITAITQKRVQYSLQSALQRELKNKTAKVGVIGLGYVGLPTACHYASIGYKVTGFDVSVTKVESLKRGINYINDVDNVELTELINKKRFTATTDMKQLGEMHVLLICVPTPVNKLKEPDISYVRDVGKIVAEHVNEGTMVILESTTYPGTTEEYICTPLTERGYVIGENLFVAYSPERIDPGNKRFNLSNTPKIVGGMTETCTDLACKFIGPTAQRVNGIRVAELSKIFENTFRWINMALVNEMTVLCNELEIDIWETINAASSKPYGFMKFTPGIGVGGHCIPVDPYYLLYKAKEHGHRTKMIELAGDINDGMVHYSYTRILELLAANDKLMKHSHVVVLGATYKSDIGDLRESPVVRLLERLQNKVQNLTVIEPYAKEIKINELILPVEKYDADILQKADLVVIGTPHNCFDWKSVHDNASLIFDSKNVMEENGLLSVKVAKL
ncbi:nucleotide sugar dehydrogenase [Peribacillus simplex]|uniref:UDP-N-acetyl-D-glucosamine dehydrogenase n=2 Tax=Peribacillus simplex TaxID=1478 RepID=A0A223EF72_9BACI|nr:nucleotide sugar dehydrogenase [Peribacillus simplex]ASS93880.1 UDP-N-acetyl-D-glucosamine dehydrogenase [Peribacillus simplex NBRC 15720 = DSM 1321]MEC1396695.1 nucleotide sugar dehydrogenase [Peribacillus simplex]MED3985155.1 nucleotide sugar dehydrogenase [Peribacillus simplex]MED4093265.1 nucleotide sugar dehydrogenase [Peribacillus simplex]TVX77692.1 nucleotide sugar dehydrogenase [Peribacillus simplex]